MGALNTGIGLQLEWYMRMTSKAVNTGILPRQTKSDRTLSSYDTGSHNVHSDKCRKSSKSAKTKRDDSSTKNR